MGGIRHTPVSDNGTGHTGDTSGRDGERAETARWQRNLWFVLAVLCLGALTALALSAGGAAMSDPGAPHVARGPATTQVAQSAGNCRGPGGAAQTAAAGGAPALAATSAASGDISRATTQNYTLNQPNAGVMQPAVDAQGNVWFGEMSLNKLARLNPTTGKVTEWQPPKGEHNIMATAIDAHGDVWFTEQAANYIGCFNPTSQQFTTYPLALVNGISVGPQDLAFDPTGMLWFTEVNSGELGRLNPTTGAIQTYKMPVPAGAQRACPFSLAITHDGQIWYGDLCDGGVGRLDPATGKVQLFQAGGGHAEIFSMAADASGRIWFTELEQGTIGVVANGKLTEIAVPTTLGDATGLYALVVGRDGSVWFACASANALVRYSPPSGAFTFDVLSVPASVPFGLSLDRSGNIWFTASATPDNYIGQLRP